MILPDSVLAGSETNVNDISIELSKVQVYYCYVMTRASNVNTLPT